MKATIKLQKGGMKILPFLRGRFSCKHFGLEDGKD